MSGTSTRLRTIDGLRGVAAMWVVLFHLDGAVATTFEHWVHPTVRWIFLQGYLGVDVFFVLSGFVIPYSVRNADLRLGFLGRFLVRRSIRLDPPYWAAILLEVLLIWLGLRIGLADTPLPSWPKVLAHVGYVQNVLGFGDIVDVFWTLCYEFQFYVGFVALLVMGSWMTSKLGSRTVRFLGVLTFTALFLVSVAGRFGIAGVQIPIGLALLRWFQFFMGTCVFWLVSGKTSWWPLIGTWLVLLGVVLLGGESWLHLTPVVASAVLLWSHKKDEMRTFLSGSTIQWLGAISYSLYLFHATIGWRWVRLAGELLGPGVPLAVVVAVFASGCGAAVACSWLAWKFLELPSMALSKRIRLGHDRSHARATQASAGASPAAAS